MASVVQFGAGAIGRGFLAQFWSAAGYETIFVDVDSELCAALNRAGEYTLSLVTKETEERITIRPIRAIPTEDREAVLAALAECEFAAVSIGPHVVDTVESFFVRTRRETPLNIIVAENDPHASETLARLFEEAAGKEKACRIAFIQAIVGRMVPKPDSGTLDVVAEPYFRLPLEPGCWLGELPTVPNLFEQEGFRKFVDKKLYIHNAGHAALAYHGYRRGKESILDCARDPEIVAEVDGFWQEVNEILTDEILTADILTRFEADLRTRFRNPALNDTVLRVARDPIRKLDAGDRLVYPALTYLEKTGKPPLRIVRAIAAALRFDAPDDPAAVRLQGLIREHGVRDAFREVAHLAGGDDEEGLVSLVEEAYNAGDFS